MATRRIDTRVIELDFLNNTDTKKSVASPLEMAKIFTESFILFGGYYMRNPGIALLASLFTVRNHMQYYYDRVETVWKTKKLRSPLPLAVASTPELVWPRSQWGKQVVYWSQRKGVIRTSITIIFTLVIVFTYLGWRFARWSSHIKSFPAIRRPPVPTLPQATPREVQGDLRIR